MRKIIFVIWIYLSMFSLVCFAAVTGKIAGTVTDKSDNEPLPGATVLIEGTTLGAACDIEGDYFILNVPPGIHEVKAIMVGYGMVVKTNIYVKTDHTTIVNFELIETVMEGEEVTIVGKRPNVELDVTGSEMVVNAEALRMEPVTDIEDIFNKQRGIFNTGTVTYVRGGIGNEVRYNLDGISMTGGVLNDNWNSMNTTALEEVAVITGGYNAEYGNAMSGVVNMVTKDGDHTHINMHGKIQYRYRPPGQYHWGQNMYDRSLKKYTDYGLDYWRERVERSPTTYANYFKDHYGWDGVRVPTAEQLYETFLHQAEGNKIMSDYDKRPDQEIEGTFHGSFLRNTSYMFSGRYHRAVSIYPTIEKYNPEYNIVAKFNYFPKQNMKLTLNVVEGGYKSAQYRNDNSANSREMGTGGAGAVPPWAVEPYMTGGYWNRWGSTYGRPTTDYSLGIYSLKWQHNLTQASFYSATLGYYTDDMNLIPDYSHLACPQQKIDESWGWQSVNNAFQLNGGTPYSSNVLKSQSFYLTGDYTNQITKAHLLKSGLSFRYNDMDFESISVAHIGINNCDVSTNIWQGNPVEVALYVQDKMEYAGIILNIGIRVDGFDTRRTFPENPFFDPLGKAYNKEGLPTNSADLWFLENDPPDYAFFYTYDSLKRNLREQGLADDAWIIDGLTDRNTVSSEWKWALAPRLGVSFPVTKTSKIRFSYGHFYQRPAWSKFYGAPISFSLPYHQGDPLGDAESMWSSLRPSGNQYWGQPGLTYEKTIQYEVGYDQDLLGILKINIAAYYKDQSQLTRFSNRPLLDYGSAADFSAGGGISQTGFAGQDIAMVAVTDPRNINANILTFANDIYKDTRGIEINIEKLFDNRWAAALTFDYAFASGAKYGFNTLREGESEMAFSGYTESGQAVDLSWLSNFRIKANFSYITPQKLAYVLGDISLGIYYEYFSGDEYTYYSPGYDGLQIPFNRRWYPHQCTDLRLTKRIPWNEVTAVFGMDVRNLFNYYDRYLPPDYQQLQYWEERQQIPLHAQSQEPHVWQFYNSFSNPKRMFYFIAGLEF
jgi:hypothetical protein